MFPKKRSFFQRITGTGYDDEEQDEFFDEDQEEQSQPTDRTRSISKIGLGKGAIENTNRSSWMEEQGDEGELSVDMYTTPDAIVVRTMIPGVKKEDIDIAISRDNLTIRGKRVEENRVADQDYHCRELYWGAFIRSITLPHEVDIDRAEASEKDGMLTLTLPRVDKGRQSKLKIKSI